jgi:hypothetical protein
LRKPSAVQRTDYDGAWKEMLDRYLEPFLRLCFPAVHAGIDWSRGFTPLDLELQEVVRDAETGKHRVDKLFQVHCHDGTEDWILVHVEVQSRPDRRLSQRLYRYYCRIRDRYDRGVLSLAVLADRSPRFRPGPHEEETLGCRLRFEYPSCKLLDLGRAMLEREDNPAALILLAHRAAQERTGDPVERKTLKWALTRPLYERGYSKEDILELFRLIDWLVQLPKEQEVEFRRQVAEYEARKHMPYITSIERLGREEGLRQGLEQGLQQGLQRGLQQGRQEGSVAARQKAVLDALEIRFGQVPDGIRERIEAIEDQARLRALLECAIQAGSIEEFIRTIRTRRVPG